MALGAVIGALAAVAAVVLLGPARAPRHSWPVPGADGTRILVEVVNGSGVDGLAWDVTRRLRRRGLDVVDYSTADEPLDSTVISLRRGDSAAARAVRRALGLGRIAVAPDARLLLDVSVLLGADARALARDP